MAKDPAFLFYSKDWLEGTAELLPAEKGVYIDLLSYQHQRGDLPSDISRLCRLVRLSVSEFTPIWEAIKGKFSANGERTLNERLALVMGERADKGKKNKIIGMFSALLRKSDLSKKDYSAMREAFNPVEFMDIDSERLSERISEWYTERLKSIANGNANEDIDINTEKYEKFIEWFNKEMGRSYRGDKTSRGQFSARLKDGYVFNNFKTALCAIKADKFHVDSNYQHITPEFLTRQDKLEKWSNVKPIELSDEELAKRKNEAFVSGL